MTTHLHHYKDGVCADPRAIGGPCGAPQVYNPPVGKGIDFTDVMIEADDLRSLLGWVEGPDYDPHGDFQHLMERIYAALDD